MWRFFSLFFLCLSPLTWAITNIQESHQAYTPGLHGETRVSAIHKSGNTASSRYDFSLKLVQQQAQARNIYLYSRLYQESNNSKTADKQFLHVRHVHNWLADWQWEVFAQLQTNAFTDLELRSLLGGGFRYIALADEKHSLAMGIGAYYTWETYDNDTVKEEDDYTRLNSYLSYLYALNEHVNISNTLYLQPRYSDPADLYAYNNLRLESRIVGELRLYIGLLHEYDSKPFAKHKKMDTTIKTGLFFNF